MDGCVVIGDVALLAVQTVRRKLSILASQGVKNATERQLTVYMIEGCLSCGSSGILG